MSAARVLSAFDGSAKRGRAKVSESCDSRSPKDSPTVVPRRPRRRPLRRPLAARPRRGTSRRGPPLARTAPRRPRRLAVTARTDTGRENQYALSRGEPVVRCAVNNVNLSGGVTSPSRRPRHAAISKYDLSLPVPPLPPPSPAPPPPPSCPIPRYPVPLVGRRAGSRRPRRFSSHVRDDEDVDAESEGRSRLVPENNCRPRYL